MLDKRVFSITCVPCIKEGIYFRPTSKNVLSGHGIAMQAHPLYGLITSLSSSKENQIEKFYAIIDDWDVLTNWVLPLDFNLTDLNSIISDFIDKAPNVSSVSPFPIEVLTLTDFLRNHNMGEVYKQWKTELNRKLLGLWVKKDIARYFNDKDLKLRDLLISSYVKRYLTYKKCGYTNNHLRKGELHTELIFRAVNNISTYIAQGRLLESLAASYYAFSRHEIILMTCDGSDFKIMLSE